MQAVDSDGQLFPGYGSLLGAQARLEGTGFQSPWRLINTELGADYDAISICSGRNNPRAINSSLAASGFDVKSNTRRSSSVLEKET